MATDFVQQQVPSAGIIVLDDFSAHNMAGSALVKRIMQGIYSRLRPGIWPDSPGYQANANPSQARPKFLIVGPSAYFSSGRIPCICKCPSWIFRLLPCPEYSASYMIFAIVSCTQPLCVTLELCFSPDTPNTAADSVTDVLLQGMELLFHPVGTPLVANVLGNNPLIYDAKLIF